MTSNYYLPINSANISQYFSRGIILPSFYIKGWIQDIQTKFNKSLLLCSKPFTNETDCSLTIVLTDEEHKYFDSITENFFLFNKPIPISRIKSLNFSDIEQRKTTIYNIEKGDAFIPNLFSDIEKQDSADVFEISNATETNNHEDYTEMIGFYDRVLGGFSLMQIADFHLKDYPNNYFKNLAFINKEVEKQIADLRFQEDFSVYLDFKRNKSAVFNKIDVNFVSNFAITKEKFKLPLNRRGLIQYDEIDKSKKSYLLAILATFGNDIGKSKTISDFVSSLINEKFDPEKKELLCFLFGINQGYSSFRNQYIIEDRKVNCKFKMDSEVDYSIIESIYQFVFNEKVDNGKFLYISEWCPKYKSTLDLQNYETYSIFDKEIIYKKKIQFGSKEYLFDLFQRFSENSMLATIFPLFKKDVEQSIQNTLNELFNKVRTDCEYECGKINITSTKQQDELSQEITELKEQIEILKKNNETNIQTISPVVDINKEQDNTVLNPKIDKDSLIKRRIEILEKISTITDLKAIGKLYGIKRYSSFKKTDEDISNLRNLIIQEIEREWNS